MAREFVMGARINMADGFSAPVSRMTSTAQQFSSAARQGDRAVAGLGHSAAASTTGLGAFTAGSRAAMLSARGLAGGIATLTTSMLGLNSVMGAILSLLTFKFAYDWLVKSNAEMETYQNTLAVVMKDSDKAAQTLKWAAEFAAQTPFEIPQIVEATTRLTTYGIVAEKTLGTIGDMASVMGKPLMQAVEAVADAQTGEVERLKEFGITKAMLAEQAKKLGTTVMDSKGSITDQTAFNAALFSLMEERYNGGMELQSKTFKGMLSNVADFIGTMGREFGKPIFDRFKTGLTGLLGILDQLKASGALQGFIYNAQELGATVADGITAVAATVGQVLSVVGAKVTEFYTANLPAIRHIIDMLSNVWLYMQNAAGPVLTWLISGVLPVLLNILGYVLGVVINIAEFILNNWSNIAPFIAGIGIALGLILGPAYALIAAAKIVTLVTQGWAIAQGILNAVMAINPVYLMIMAIGLLIGAAIWLIANWDMVKAKFFEVWGAVSNFMVNLASQAYEWGANIIRTLVSGILSMKDYLVQKVSDVFSSVRKLMPFSDAKEGPFSQLTYSGGALLSTMAQGVLSSTDTLYNALNTAFDGAVLSPVVTAAGKGINPAGGGTTGTGGKSIQLSFGNIQITAAAGQDAKEIAQEVINILHDTLAGADDIIGEEMGELL